MCDYCRCKTDRGKEFGKDYQVEPCANGDLGARAQYVDRGIILYVDRFKASGYFDINYCPMCGRKLVRE